MVRYFGPLSESFLLAVGSPAKGDLSTTPQFKRRPNHLARRSPTVYPNEGGLLPPTPTLRLPASISKLGSPFDGTSMPLFLHEELADNSYDSGTDMDGAKYDLWI